MPRPKEPLPVERVVNELPLSGAVKQIPAALHQTLCESARLESRILALEREHAVRAADIATDILERKGADNRPLAGNDTVRKALIERETAADSECQRLLSELAGLKGQQRQRMADAEVLRVSARLVAAGSEPDHP